MASAFDVANHRLRRALESTGQRFTAQRAAVYRFLLGTTTHPSADEVFREVRRSVPGISLATVYKTLETLVDCGLVSKLTYSEDSARYDARTDPHHHARCLDCGRVMDVPAQLPPGALGVLEEGLEGFSVLGYRLELTGRCRACSLDRRPATPASPELTRNNGQIARFHGTLKDSP